MGTKTFDGLRWRKTVVMIALVGLVLFQSAWSVSARPQNISNFVVQCPGADLVCDPGETFQAPLNVNYDNLYISAYYTGLPENVSLQVLSSAPTVLPEANINIMKTGDSNGDIYYTVELTPIKAGTTAIQVIFSDGQETVDNTYYYNVTNNYIYLPLVLKPSAPPVLSKGYSVSEPIPTSTSKSINLDDSIFETLRLFDSDSPMEGWKVTVTSSDQNVIPNANITVNMTPIPQFKYIEYNLDIKPKSAGTTTLTLVASDGEGSSSTYYMIVTVTQNSKPVVSGLPTTQQTLKLNQPTKITFTATDADGHYPLTFDVSGLQFDPKYDILKADYVVTGSAPTYTLTVTPREVVNNASIFIVATDSTGLKSDNPSFTLKVIP